MKVEIQQQIYIDDKLTQERSVIADPLGYANAFFWDTARTNLNDFAKHVQNLQDEEAPF